MSPITDRSPRRSLASSVDRSAAAASRLPRPTPVADARPLGARPKSRPPAPQLAAPARPPRPEPAERAEAVCRRRTRRPCTRRAPDRPSGPAALDRPARPTSDRSGRAGPICRPGAVPDPGLVRYDGPEVAAGDRRRPTAAIGGSRPAAVGDDPGRTDQRRPEVEASWSFGACDRAVIGWWSSAAGLTGLAAAHRLVARASAAGGRSRWWSWRPGTGSAGRSGPTGSTASPSRAGPTRSSPTSPGPSTSAASSGLGDQLIGTDDRQPPVVRGPQRASSCRSPRGSS